MKRYSVQIQQICQAFKVPYRSGNYVLQHGYIPDGVDPAPNSGTPRQFNAAQAFWMGMVLVLREEKIKTAAAVKIADYAWQSLRTVSEDLGWDPEFSPHQGRLRTKYQYLLEVAGSTRVRFGTSADPSGGGRVRYLAWHLVGKPGRAAADFRPYVTVRLDLTRVAETVRSLDLAVLDGR